MAGNVEQAHYLGKMIEKEPDMELLAPIGLDIVCFRFNPGRLDDTQRTEQRNSYPITGAGDLRTIVYDLTRSILSACGYSKSSQRTG